MIGITKIGTYIPEVRQSNLDLLDIFETNESFIREKIGVVQRAIKEPEQKSSDLCIRAFDDLLNKDGIDINEIECCVVVTQNPDFNIPHTSAIVHGALGLPERCASFDISLGCSGYVYGLSIVTSFMAANGFTKGLVFTADPYSEVINKEDKNTALIFGDAATVTLLEKDLGLVPLGFDFGSRGKDYDKLINKDGSLYMNGRAVFNFTATTVPSSVESLLAKIKIAKDDVDRWYFHQGSKYIVDAIRDRLELSAEKVIFDMYDYGNTVSSSIPLLLSKDMDSIQPGQLLGLSGFGVGLSWGSTVLRKS